MMIEDMAPFLVGTDLPAAEPGRLRGGLVVHQPRAFVEAVDMLLDVMVAGQPSEIQPVAHLVFHLGPFGLAAAVPERAREIVFLDGADFADGAVEDALHRFADAIIVTPAEPRY